MNWGKIKEKVPSPLPALSRVEGGEEDRPALSRVEGPALSRVEGPALSGACGELFDRPAVRPERSRRKRLACRRVEGVRGSLPRGRLWIPAFAGMTSFLFFLASCSGGGGGSGAASPSHTLMAPTTEGADAEGGEGKGPQTTASNPDGPAADTTAKGPVQDPTIAGPTEMDVQTADVKEKEGRSTSVTSESVTSSTTYDQSAFGSSISNVGGGVSSTDSNLSNSGVLRGSVDSESAPPSPDRPAVNSGYRIVFEGKTEGGDTEVYTLNPSDGTLVNVSNNGGTEDGGPFCYNRSSGALDYASRALAQAAPDVTLLEIKADNFSWRPDCGAFAVRKEAGAGNGDIRVYPVSGVATDIAMTTADETYPIWSPDGNYLAYLEFKTAPTVVSYKIIIWRRSDGRRVDLEVKDDLGRPARLFRTLAWSPDGTRLAYQALIGGSYDLHLLPFDAVNFSIGTPARIATAGVSEKGQILWAADGSAVATWEETSSALNLVKILLTGDVSVIFSDDVIVAVDTLVSWSRGNQLAFFSINGERDRSRKMPAWSPDDRWIAYIKVDGAAQALVLKTALPLTPPSSASGGGEGSAGDIPLTGPGSIFPTIPDRLDPTDLSWASRPMWVETN